MELREMIMELASRTGPSGFECRAAEKARELLELFADEISTDVLGNLIAVRRCGEANAPLVLLDAPLDAPENLPSVISATEESSPMPAMAEVGLSISLMPGPPLGPS